MLSSLISISVDIRHIGLIDAYDKLDAAGCSDTGDQLTTVKMVFTVKDKLFRCQRCQSCHQRCQSCHQSGTEMTSFDNCPIFHAYCQTFCSLFSCFCSLIVSSACRLVNLHIVHLLLPNVQPLLLPCIQLLLLALLLTQLLAGQTDFSLSNLSSSLYTVHCTTSILLTV
jgi:hypothetical protein